MKTSPMWISVLAMGVVGGAPFAHAQVMIETVAVGNPGNTGENQSDGIHGAVAYEFWIGNYEVTADQYTAFLNAVAASDPEHLYNTNMDYDADPSREGCNIKRFGTPGSYTYSVAPDWEDRPVNYVSWADAARFANWMHNGQPTGAQDLTTTEDGAYFLDGIGELDDNGLEDVLRESDANWVIPSEDEWYKAAYHKNDGATGNYWNYPTSADGGVSQELIDPDPGNNATFSINQVSFTIGAPYWRTEGGAHENSESAYGTFDQGGNVMEFTEAVPEPNIRRIRGGSWLLAGSQMSASQVDDVMHSSDQFNDLGFRVVTLTEPSQPVPALSNRGFWVMLIFVFLLGASAAGSHAFTAKMPKQNGNPGSHRVDGGVRRDFPVLYLQIRGCSLPAVRLRFRPAASGPAGSRRRRRSGRLRLRFGAGAGLEPALSSSRAQVLEFAKASQKS